MRKRSSCGRNHGTNQRFHQQATPMGNRIRQSEEKVEPIEIALKQINIAKVARETGAAESTVRRDLKKVKEALPELLSNKKPGPKAEKSQEEATPEPEAERKVCPECGGKLNKNGTYWMVNWVSMLLVGWLGLVEKLRIQRWRCRECGMEVADEERVRQQEARKAWWQVVNRLIALSRFKLGLSERKTQTLVKFTYAKTVSRGYIGAVTGKVGQCAEKVLAKFSQCKQKTADFLLYDETFPKLEERAYRLGVAICEHGLIRSVYCITKAAKDIPVQLKNTVCGYYKPSYFLTDLDVTYNAYMKKAGLELTHLRDTVHLLRQIIRLFDDAVREVTIDFPKSLSFKQRKEQRKLKQRLLRKQLQPLLYRAFRAFSSGRESICTLMLESIVADLQNPQFVIQTASVQRLAKRLQKFVKKHAHAIDQLLLLATEQNAPKTTNSLESKNSILKPFSRIAKFFPSPASCQSFFAGVALMENCDFKTRGIHQGTSALQRAQIDLDDLGGHDFFSLVGLPNPPLSLAFFTD